MLKSRFSERIDWVSIKVGYFFSMLGISPNMWTLLSLLPALAGFVSLYYRSLLLGALLFFISGFIDLIDGSVARVTSSVSNLGAFLDGIIDRYVEILLYVGLWVYLSGEPSFILPTSFWIMLLVFGSVMPSYVRAYADHKNVVTDPEAQRRMGGLLERSERLDLLYLGMLLGYFDVNWLLYAIALVAVLSNLTAFQRIFFVLKRAKSTNF